IFGAASSGIGLHERRAVASTGQNAPTAARRESLRPEHRLRDGPSGFAQRRRARVRVLHAPLHQHAAGNTSHKYFQGNRPAWASYVLSRHLLRPDTEISEWRVLGGAGVLLEPSLRRADCPSAALPV